ncbi:MAG TPA: class I mannose-6-phosphate isomerase, partial [Armatimonadota bacterium]|nr:class I mannose-6-phosphate isomerase [Armatimonadota bacterium]
MDVYPLRFSDLFMERVWGGRGLERVLGKTLPPEKRIGESWEVSDQPGAMSAVRNGAYAGLTLGELRERFPEELMGPRGLAMGRGRFPLLIKFLDCEDRLSVQVHPDDAYAAAHEGGSLGKTEMWYVVAAEPGAVLWCGLKPGID